MKEESCFLPPNVRVILLRIMPRLEGVLWHSPQMANEESPASHQRAQCFEVFASFYAHSKEQLCVTADGRMYC